jgi:DinB superfamily
MTDPEGGLAPGGARGTALPPLAAEDHRCARCELSYPDVAVEQAVATVRGIPDAAREAALAVPSGKRRQRPEPGTWSVTEYVCHLRDVYVAYTIRLHRARTEDRPQLEPMLNGLRARRFRYNERDVSPVLDDLALCAAGFCDEVARTGEADWSRLVTRLPGEQRTALWLVRQAMHEGVHHVRDIRLVGESVTADGPQRVIPPRRG